MSVDHNADTSEYPVLPTLLGAHPLPSSRIAVDLGGASHRGNVRSRNEDVFVVARRSRELDVLLTNLPADKLPDRVSELSYGLLVADGMGGVAGGDVASRLAATTLLELVLQTSDWIMLSDGPETDRILRRIEERYHQVHDALRAEGWENPKLWGMGTTLTLAVSLGLDLYLGHVGDSRAYLHRDDELRQLTRDHTVVQALLDSGAIPPTELAMKKFRNVLTRVIGGTDDLTKVDLHQARLRDGDQLLLCTDGLTKMVEDAVIADILQRSATAAEACQALVAQALANGGRDNVTVALARFHLSPSS